MPEAQLDRFLFRLFVGYPPRDEERRLVAMHGHGTVTPRPEDFGVEAITEAEFLTESRALVRDIGLSDELIDYIVDVVRATRNHPSFLCGASPRAASVLAAASRAWAAMEGRDYVIPDDIKYLSECTLAHRVVLTPTAEIEGGSVGAVLENHHRSDPGSAMMRPTSRCLVFFGLAGVSAILPAVVDGSLWTLWLAMVAAILALIAGDAVAATSPSRISLKIEAPAEIPVGGVGRLSIELEFPQPLLRPVRVLIDVDPTLEPPPLLEVALESDAVSRSEFVLRARRRGLARVHAIWLSWTGPLQFVEIRHRRELAIEIPLVPDIGGGSASALRFLWKTGSPGGDPTPNLSSAKVPNSTVFGNTYRGSTTGRSTGRPVQGIRNSCVVSTASRGTDPCGSPSTPDI